jgi:hypothetical protein
LNTILSTDGIQMRQNSLLCQTERKKLKIAYLYWHALEASDFNQLDHLPEFAWHYDLHKIDKTLQRSRFHNTSQCLRLLQLEKERISVKPHKMVFYRDGK